MWNLIFLFTGLIFTLLVFFVFFTKDIVSIRENNTFKLILIFSVIAYLIEIPLQLIVRFYGVDNMLVTWLAKIFVINIMVWYTFFTIYAFIVCFNKSNIDKYNKHIKIGTNAAFIYLAVASFVIIKVPILKYYDYTKMYVYGPAIDALKIILGTYIFLYIILLTINVKKLINKKYVPLYFVLFLLGLSALIQFVDPSILITSMIGTFICYTMFFTIENPDLKMLNELYKNKKLIESSNQDIANLLFKISSEVRGPIKNMIAMTDDDSSEKIREINGMAKHIDYLIDDALDLSGMSTKRIKLYESKYKPSTIFNELSLKTQSSINENIHFEYVASENIPEFVYGDGVRFRQLLAGILDNAIKHTEEGFISFEVNTIVKYDICRFIIEVSDAGSGMPIDKVNEVLALKDTDMEAIDDHTDNLKLLKILANKLGGSFMIRSDKDIGTTVSITIDQKIASEEETDILRKLDQYSSYIHTNNRIIVVDTNSGELNRIASFLEEKENLVYSSLYSRDVIEKVTKSLKYDLIILDNNLDNVSAYDILMQLKKIPGFNIPTYIMIRENELSIKMALLKDGFSDVIVKEKMLSELDRILKKDVK